jgi:hypothetical protein
MKTLYFNCSAGISGDMFVGALLDLTHENKFLIQELKKLNLKNYKIKITNINKKGINATKFTVITKEETEHRNLKDIYNIIDKSSLDINIKSLSKKIFLKLGEAEAEVHNTSIDQVHFHEVGAIDSIIDIVSASILLNKIKPDRIYSSRISTGRGKIKFCHGETTLPVPAVRKILEGVPLRTLNIPKELTTPTGAAIIKTITHEFTDLNLEKAKTGFGAGTRNLDIPNVLEVNLIESNISKKIILETNIDDMNPEFYNYIIEKIIKEGAKDAWVCPSIMKKNRTGSLLTVICDEEVKDKIIECIFDETTTFGIRISYIHRVELEREIKKVKTKYGFIDVKIGKYKGKIKTISPEYESCKKIAEEKNIPLKKVYDEVKKQIS